MANTENPEERRIAPTFDERGNPSWQSIMSPPDGSLAGCMMVPDRIIPIIFVPGVMGSNLKGIGKSKKITWRLDGLTCLQVKKIALGATLALCFSVGRAMIMVTSGTLAALRVKHVSKRWSGFRTLARKAPYFSGAPITMVGHL